MAEAFAKPDSLPFITHYVQRRRKKRKSSLPTIAQRYFTDLTAAGGQYYSLSNPITLTGDYEWEVEYAGAGVDFSPIITASDDLGRVSRIDSGGVLRVYSGSTSRPSITAINDGLLHKLGGKRVGQVMSVLVDSSEENSIDSVNVLGDVVIGFIGKRSPLFLDGILANLKIWTGGDRNTGTLIGDFPLDEDWAVDNIAHNRANPSNNATATNITDADATERRRSNSFSPNRWVNVDDPNDYIEIAGT